MSSFSTRSQSSFGSAFPQALLMGAGLLLVAVGAANAEPATTHGRSPDGRAYRIENGMKLTDYIAELEVANDDLHRQLDAAEEELAVKDAKLQHSGKGGQTTNNLREQNLIAPIANVPKPALPPAVVPQDAISACNSTVQSLNNKVLDLEEELRKAPAAVPAAASMGQPATVKCDYNSAENPYLARTKSLEASLSQRASDNEVLQSEHNRRLAAEQEVAKTKSDLAAQIDQSKDAADRFAETKQQLDSANDRVASLQDQLKDAQTATAKTAAEPARAALAEAVPPTPKKVDPGAEEQPAATQIATDAAAVTAARTEFRNELQKIQALIIERKNMLDSVKSRGKGVSISVQPLVAKSGASLDTLRLQVQKLDESSNIGAIRDGLSEVTVVLNDDVQTLQRLSK